MEKSKNRRKDWCVNGSHCLIRQPPSVKDLVYCYAKDPHPFSYWVCTRPKGHSGVHIACNTQWHHIADWKNNEEA
jgi:hypothetical protein